MNNPSVHETKVLEFWDELDLVTKVMEKNRGKKKFSFFDGPVTANNALGVHHAWGRTYKDVVQRYKALKGYDQRFQNGFDCQGLWVEVEVEKSLNLDSKQEILDFKLDRFSDACKDRVDTYSQIQTEQSRHLGQMMDWKNSYYTHTDQNITHIWYFLKECHKRGWLYRGHHPMPWCWRCGTSLSSHEQADSYREITHTALYVKFPFRDGFLLVWTTTPWTLPANVAVAVNPEFEYAAFELNGEVLYAGSWLGDTLLKKYSVQGTFTGKKLVGEGYFYPFETDHQFPRILIAWNEVNMEEGTGLVHMATGCGLEDYLRGKELDLTILHALDESGHYIEGYQEFSGKFYAEVNLMVAQFLSRNDLLFKEEMYTHRYPVCWRCKEELVYRLVDEWFLSSEEVRPLLLEASESVVWDPPYLKKQFKNWLENMGDWCVSRKRFWGLPLPFYPCDCGHLTVLGSRDDLSSLPQELHRPWVDKVVVNCEKCGQPVKRVRDVGDCWLDAGVMSFSTLNYLGNYEYWQEWYPADFVCEMREQTRLWFYSMMYMGVTLTGRPPFKYVYSYEKVDDKDGNPLHKSGKNVIWLDEVLNDTGADVLRALYLSQSRKRNMRFDLKRADFHVKTLKQFYNSVKFLVTYADLDAFQFDEEFRVRDNLLDKWMNVRLQQFVERADRLYSSYQFVELMTEFTEFVEELSNWYVRRSRRKFWVEDMSHEKGSAMNTLFLVLKTLAVVVAPMFPFLSEVVYQKLKNYAHGEVSVHLEKFPKPLQTTDSKLLPLMNMTREFTSLGLQLRQSMHKKVKYPLKECLLFVSEPSLYEFTGLIKEELNVERIRFLDSLDWYVKIELKPNYRLLGAKLGNRTKLLKRTLQLLSQSKMKDYALRGKKLSLDLNGEVLEVNSENFTTVFHWRAGYRGGTSPFGSLLLSEAESSDLVYEGKYREFLRYVQLERKKLNLEISELVEMRFNTPDKSFEDFLWKKESRMRSDARLSGIRKLEVNTGDVVLDTLNLEFSLFN